MSRVALLSETVASQVAAGEVIERPASLVKELVENSLDAGAGSIEITIQRGGIALVRVVDDGCGMDRDDALLCLERHATSKIRSGRTSRRSRRSGSAGRRCRASRAFRGSGYRRASRGARRHGGAGQRRENRDGAGRGRRARDGGGGAVVVLQPACPPQVPARGGNRGRARREPTPPAGHCAPGGAVRVYPGWAGRFSAPACRGVAGPHPRPGRARRAPRS